MSEYISFCKEYNLKVNQGKSLSIYTRFKSLQKKHESELNSIKIRGL